MKRILDISGAAIGLIVFSPILIVIALMIRREMGSLVLFRQTRPGIQGKPFQMIKFRTMKNAVDEQGNVLPDAERLTKLGRFLRSSSLDELPGLWNVLKGEMSLVGPRPLLMEYLPLYSPEQARRQRCARRNGLGPDQWSQRDLLGRKFALDVWYVENRNIWLDLKIIWLTIRKVFKREGISAAGEATMSKFTGSGS